MRDVAKVTGQHSWTDELNAPQMAHFADVARAKPHAQPSGELPKLGHLNRKQIVTVVDAAPLSRERDILRGHLRSWLPSGWPLPV